MAVRCLIDVRAGCGVVGACSPTVVLEFSELIKAAQVQLIPEQRYQSTSTVVQSIVELFLAQAG